MKVISFWVKRKVPRVSINVGKQTCECLFQLALHWSSMEGKRRLWSLMLDCQLFKNKHIDHITAMVCMLGIGVVKKIDSNQNYQIQKMKWPFKEKRLRPWQDSNLQSPDPKSGALSIRPHGLILTVDSSGQIYFCFVSNYVAMFKSST